jgi:hypothetical protein
MMVICGLGITRYLLNHKTEVLHASEGVQTDSPHEDPNKPDPPTGSELVTLA